MGKTPKGDSRSWNSEIAGKISAGVRGVSLISEKIEKATKATKNGMLYYHYTKGEKGSTSAATL
jgi:hypothetical protein